MKRNELKNQGVLLLKPSAEVLRVLTFCHYEIT